MSSTKTVPAAVPSVYQSSSPTAGAVDPFVAANKRPEPNGAYDDTAVLRIALAVPGKRSVIRAVPAGVPSVFHSSRPVPTVAVESSAEKYIVLPTTVMFSGVDEEAPG